MADIYEDLPVVLEVSSEARACSNCNTDEKVDKLPTKMLCYSTWHLQYPYPVAGMLTTQVYLYHTSCQNGNEWRRDNGDSGFPKFIAILHERYAPASVTLKCEGCGTTIKHGSVHTTPVEDY